MAATHGSKARVYMNGHNIGQWLTSVDVSSEMDTHDSSTLATETAKTFVPGLLNATASMEGLWSGDVDEIDEIFALLAEDPDNAAAILSYMPAGDAFGSRFTGVSGWLTSYDSDASLDGLVTANAEIQSNVAADRGVVLHALGAEAGDGNGTAHDNAASSLLGAAGYLQVVSGTSLVVKIQHSTDSSTWADLITFASASARGAQRVATAAGVTVNRYTRVLWTGSGTFAAGVARLTTNP